MSKPCQLRVLSSGKYCCEVDQFEVYDNCIGQLKFANLPEVLIEYEITPDTWIPANPASIAGSGCESLYKAGTYRFNLDCEALNGTVAPEEAPMSLCYECCRIEDYGQELLACFQDLKALIVASDDATALAEIIANLEALCTKLLDMLTALEVLPALCEKLEAVIESLDSLCDKIEEGFADMLECLEDIKASLALVVDGLTAICDKLDTANESLTALCEKLDTANESLTALCEKLDAILAAVIATTAAIALLKECNTAENEAICAKLEALLEQGAADAECLAQIKTLLEEAKACNTTENEAICEKLDSLLEVVCPQPPCAAEGTAPVTYTNSDNTTELDVSVGGNGDIKITSGNGDDSDAEITAYIEACLAAGNDVELSIEGVEGETATATLLAAAQTNPFPGFYNQSVNATATPTQSFKVQSMTATCLETVEEAGVTLKTYDQCAVDVLETSLDVQEDMLNCLEEGKTTETIQCWKDKFIEGGLDNTFTSFRHTGQIFTVTFDNGDVDTFGVPSATGWTDQVQQMATGLDAIMPWAQTVEPFCNLPGGCGGLPAPVVELNQMFARYVGFRVCPGDKVPVIVEYTSDQLETPKSLVVQYVETDTIYIDRCVDCDGNETYLVDGEPYEPICAIPCEDSFPEVPLSVCSAAYLEGCDNVNSSVLTDFVPVIRVVQDCGSGLSVSYMIEEDSALVDYSLVGQFVDCATGEPIEEPVQECDEPTIVRCEDPCDTGSTYINGRPPASNAWTWGPYSEANLNDFEAALTAAGYTVHIVGEKHQICPVFGAFGEDPNALVDNGLAEFAATVEPNIDPAHVSEITCAELTVGKNDDLLLGLIKRLVESSELSAAKACLMEEHLNPAGPCPAEVVTLDKEALTLTLRGDVTANYSAGQAINLQNANGEACGDATVAEGEGNVTLVDGNTVIKIVECELEEGKTPVQIVKATPISQPVKLAIATVKTLTAVKTFTTVKEATR